MNTNNLIKEKISFENSGISLAGAGMAAMCMGMACPPLYLETNLKLNTDNSCSYHITPVSDVSHSSQSDYFAPYTKDYNLLLMRLDEIRGFQKNWNGHNADKISIDVINRAKNFLEHIKDLSGFISIFPTARQSIQLEFETDDKYCEVEIFSSIFQIYAEKNDEEYVNSQFDSIAEASLKFKTIFND